MTQIFADDGAVRAATVLGVSPVIVSQVKSKDKDGYDAVQVGTGVRKDKNISKAVKGHIKGLNLAEKTGFTHVKEFSAQGGPASGWKRGDIIPLDTFIVGDKVEVSAISKGRGFQGVVKRHGFHGGPRTHGQKHSEREPGSIGGGGRDGGRVAKGKRMAGRMGSQRVTIKNLEILGIDVENNSILISGAIPGRRGTLVEIKSK